MVYHVLNRGNGRMRIFHKGEDFEAFEQVLSEGLQRYPVDLFTFLPGATPQQASLNHENHETHEK